VPVVLKNLIGGRLLARNTVWNLVGEGAPLLVGVVAIPMLVHALGTARFGILMIVWMLIGYLSLFDLGMGRALTNLVAQKVAKSEEESLPPLIWTASLLMLGLAACAGLLLASGSHWLVYSVLKIPVALKHESLVSLCILSCALPAVILSSGFRGVLEAYQRFDAANAVRIPMGILSFAGPLAVLPFSHSLIPVVTVLGAGRYIGAISYFVAGRILLPVMRMAPQWDAALVRPLLNFGGWMTVSNVVAPMMEGMDRFLVGAIVSVQAVGYYATPYEVVTKLLVIPIAFGGVLFPAFSAALVSDATRARHAYRRTQKLLAVLMAPVILLVILGARPGLGIWLGLDFATHSTMVLQALSVGIFANACAYIPAALIQGAGHPDWTAKAHLVEAPIYLAIFWVLTTRFGIVGAAATWTIRVAIDMIVLMFMGEKILRCWARGAEIRRPRAAIITERSD